MGSDRTFLDQFNHHFERINDELGRDLNSYISLIEDIGQHSLLGEGKRLRPLLYVLSCKLCGYQGGDVYRFSTIFEYAHTASLLHDDVLDNAEMRRKKPSASHIWGNSAAVLGGDFFYSRAVAIALDINNMRLSKALNDTVARMVEGQFLELENSHNWTMKKDEYMDIIVAKTAVLISAACRCGAIIAGAEKHAVDHLGKFGLNLGIAFQLIDDILDYTSCQKDLGKPVGKDLREGKITLPLIYTLSDLESAEIERLKDLFSNHKADDEDYKRLITRVRNREIIERIRSDAKDYVDKAAGFLDLFPGSPVKENLVALSKYIIKRNF
ncbi:MAG: polyprenyl synthetase family protein [Deltaproteobacteria bacterium]|nr:polyprenyl synthetase family protein [Deltaproteobacteria bacterium]